MDEIHEHHLQPLANALQQIAIAYSLLRMVDSKRTRTSSHSEKCWYCGTSTARSGILHGLDLVRIFEFGVGVVTIPGCFLQNNEIELLSTPTVFASFIIENGDDRNKGMATHWPGR